MGPRRAIHPIALIPSHACHPPSAEDQGELRFTRLYREHEPMINKLAQRYSTTHGVPLDILVQAGRLGLVRADQLWHPARGATFATYLFHWVRGKIRREAVRERSIVTLPDKAYARGERITLVPIDAPPEETDADHPAENMHDSLVGSVPPPEDYDRHDAILRAIADLPVELRLPLDLYFFADMNCRQVGEHIGVTHQIAHHRVKKALAILHRKLQRES